MLVFIYYYCYYYTKITNHTIMKKKKKYQVHPQVTTREIRGPMRERRLGKITEKGSILVTDCPPIEIMKLDFLAVQIFGKETGIRIGNTAWRMKKKLTGLIEITSLLSISAFVTSLVLPTNALINHMAFLLSILVFVFSVITIQIANWTLMKSLLRNFDFYFLSFNMSIALLFTTVLLNKGYEAIMTVVLNIFSMVTLFCSDAIPGSKQADLITWILTFAGLLIVFSMLLKEGHFEQDLYLSIGSTSLVSLRTQASTASFNCCLYSIRFLHNIYRYPRRFTIISKSIFIKKCSNAHVMISHAVLRMEPVSLDAHAAGEESRKNKETDGGTNDDEKIQSSSLDIIRIASCPFTPMNINFKDSLASKAIGPNFSNFCFKVASKRYAPFTTFSVVLSGIYGWCSMVFLKDGHDFETLLGSICAILGIVAALLSILITLRSNICISKLLVRRFEFWFLNIHLWTGISALVSLMGISGSLRPWKAVYLVCLIVATMCSPFTVAQPPRRFQFQFLAPIFVFGGFVLLLSLGKFGDMLLTIGTVKISVRARATSGFINVCVFSARLLFVTYSYPGRLIQINAPLEHEKMTRGKAQLLKRTYEAAQDKVRKTISK